MELSCFKGAGGVLCCQGPRVTLLDGGHSSHTLLFVNPVPTEQTAVEGLVHPRDAGMRGLGLRAAGGF